MQLMPKVSILTFIFSVLSVFLNFALAEDKAALAEYKNSHERLLISNVNILTMVGKKPSVLRNYSVLIEHGVIVQVAPVAALVQFEDAHIIKGHGRFLLPGLMDVHVHLWDEPELSAYLAFGITTVRNASGMPFHLTFAKEIAAGNLDGPRLITTGPILNGQGPNTQVNHQVVNNAEEARQAVRQQYQQGYRHIKVYSNLSREAYEAILQESQVLRMSIMGHTPEGVRDEGVPHKKPFNIAFGDILDDGFVSIEHMESIIWHGLYDELNESKARLLAKKIAKTSTAVTPTLLAHRNLMLVAQSQGKYLERQYVEFLNPFISSFEKESYDYWAKQPASARKGFDDFYLRATKIFHEEGVSLLAGTDSGIFTNVPGVSLIEELELLVEAGLTPYQALTTATATPARVLGLDGQVGKIKLGYVADLILVDKDPTQDIGHLRSLSGLMVRGKWYDASAIVLLKQKAATTSYAKTEQRVREGLLAQGVLLD